MACSRTSPMDRKHNSSPTVRRSYPSPSFASTMASAVRAATSGLNATSARGSRRLAERSQRPHVCPTQTPEEVVQALIETRERHPSHPSAPAAQWRLPPAVVERKDERVDVVPFWTSRTFQDLGLSEDYDYRNQNPKHRVAPP